MSSEKTDPAFFIAEYSALREEILKRKEIQHQIISLTLIVAGTFLTIGVQANVSASALLVYPILAMFLAAGWAQNDVRINQIAFYIRERLEKQLGSTGWENYRQTERVSSKWGPLASLGAFSARGVFVSTQLLAIALSLTKFASTTEEQVLLAIDALAVTITFFLLRRWRQKQAKR
jgi:hypothetical protein